MLASYSLFLNVTAQLGAHSHYDKWVRTQHYLNIWLVWNWIEKNLWCFKNLVLKIHSVTLFYVQKRKARNDHPILYICTVNNFTLFYNYNFTWLHFMYVLIWYIIFFPITFSYITCKVIVIPIGNEYLYPSSAEFSSLKSKIGQTKVLIHFL